MSIKATAKKAQGKKTLAVRSKDGKHLAGSISLGGKVAPTSKKQVKNNALVKYDESTVETANALYSQYLDSLAFYSPIRVGASRQPFRAETNKVTKNFIRGSIYNARGVKVGSYRKDVTGFDEIFHASFVDKASRDSFEKTVVSNYDVSGYGDFGVFTQPNFRVNYESISRYVGYLHHKKYPKKVKDFLEEAKNINDQERDNLIAEYKSGL